jgi:hypothetical protein
MIFVNEPKDSSSQRRCHCEEPTKVGDAAISLSMGMPILPLFNKIASLFAALIPRNDNLLFNYYFIPSLHGLPVFT